MFFCKRRKISLFFCALTTCPNERKKGVIDIRRRFAAELIMRIDPKKHKYYFLMEEKSYKICGVTFPCFFFWQNNKGGKVPKFGVFLTWKIANEILHFHLVLFSWLIFFHTFTPTNFFFIFFLSGKLRRKIIVWCGSFFYFFYVEKILISASLRCVLVDFKDSICLGNF